MKKQLLSFILFFIPLISIGQNAIDLLQSSFKKCQSVSNGYFEMDKFKRYMNHTDTIFTSVKGNFKKLTNDSIFPIAFNLQFSYQSAYAGNLLFTGKDFVRYFTNDSTGIIMSADRWAEQIKGYQTDSKIYMPFTSKTSFPLPQPSDYTDNRHTFKLLGQETISGHHCYHIEVKETPKKDDTEGIKTLDSEYNYWINIQDSIPVQYTIRYDLSDNQDTSQECEKVVLTDYKLNTIKNNSAFELSSIPSYYKLQDYVQASPKKLLPKNTLAPQWALYTLDNKKISLNNLRGKFVLLDFFYKSCYPCIQSMPALEELYKKYKNKGLSIIGVDAIDSRKEELQTFLVKHKVTYQVVFDNSNNDTSIDKRYNVTACPTIYLINEKGKVIYTHLGYSSEFESELEKIIKKNL